MSNYKDYIIEEYLYNDEKDFRLEKTYELCVNELGLQQSKRDQIIAFYIAIISFVIPAIIGMNLNNYAKTAGFFALYLLGSMLSKVVVRYRIYKEVYWITCRTITQLYNFHQDKLTKDLLQHIFYTTLKKNMPTVIELCKKNKDKVDQWKSYIKIRNSAETILYEVLVLLSSLVLWIGIFILFPIGFYGAIAATIPALLNYIYWTIYYYRRLTSVYAVFTDAPEDSDDSFNKVYSKAWFLHSFYQ